MTEESAKDLWAHIKRSGGNYWKASEVGDRAYGVVTEVSIGHDFNGKDCPQFTLQPHDGSDPITVTAAQAMLKNAVKDDPPSVGATVDIELVEVDSSNGRTLKKFSYTVVPGSDD